MSLIHDIQAAAISQETDVPTLLRMCKLLAARIAHNQFAQWVDSELNGYPNIKSLPDYRVVRVDSYGSLYGSFSRADKLQIPISILPEGLREHYRHAYMASSISAYSALVDGNKSGSVQEAWPMELAVHHATKAVLDMQCISAWKEIPIGAIVRLLDSVKTRVLGFAIDLEREAPDAGDTPIGKQPQVSQEKMTQIFNTNINGSVGNLANAGTEFSQSSTMSISAGDWQGLNAYLATLGLKEEDFKGLRVELEAARELTSPKEALEGTAGNWVGRLAAKAASGISGVGIEVAAAGIAKAIALYLGLPGA